MSATTREQLVEKCKRLAAEMNRYFTSGNSVPVEKATVPASGWHPLHAAIDELAASPEAPAPQGVQASAGLAWAVSRWDAEVRHRPLANKHRRSLDDAWRQVLRYFGGDPARIIGPSHDDLVAATPPSPPAVQPASPAYEGIEDDLYHLRRHIEGKSVYGSAYALGWLSNIERALAKPAVSPDVQELVEVLRGAVDMAWAEDSHQVEFDGTVVFGPGYDFEGLDGHRRIEFLGEVECIVWPKRGGNWSAYCTHEGNTWFERFATAEDAKEACMRLLDKVIPEHPAMKARATLSKYGSKQ